jgi:hypothetical protein
MANHAQADQERLEQLLAELQGLGFCLPGSITERKLPCGNPNCACKKDPAKRHGPYTYWTRTVGGRTIAQLLSAEQRQRYQPWINNHRRLRALTKQIEALSVEAAQHAEGWSAKQPSTPPGQRR